MKTQSLTMMMNERRWQSAIETGQLGVWDLHPQLDTVHYPAPWKQRLGFPNALEADSTAFWRCRVHPDDLAPMLRALLAHQDGSAPSYEAKFRLRSNGSGYRLMHSRGRVVERDARGQAVRMLGTMVDLSPQPASPKEGLAGGVRGSPAAPLAPTALPFHLLLGVHGGGSEAEAWRHPVQAAEDCDRLLGLMDDLLDISLHALAR